MSFIKTFFKDSVIYAVPNFVSRAISALLIPLYTRILMPSDYGVLDLLLAFGILMNMIVAFEIGQGNAWYYIHAAERSSKRAYASTALFFTMACYAIFLVAGLMAAPYISHALLGATGMESLVRLAVVYIWLNGIFSFLQNQLRWELRSKDYAVASFIVSIVTPVLVLILAYMLDLKLSGVLLGMIGGLVIAAFYSLWQLKASFDPQVDFKKLRQMLSFSLPLVPSGLAVFMTYYIDRMMIRHYMTLDDVGVYGVAFRLAGMAGLLVVGFRIALTPMILTHHQEKETPGHLALIFRIFLACSFMLALGITVFSQEILFIMTTPAYYSAGALIPYLVPATLLANMYIFAPGTDIVKKTHLILLINAVVALANILLNYLLIPPYGLAGAAAANLLGSAAMFGGYMAFSQKFYPVPHEWKKLSFSGVGIAMLIFAGSTTSAPVWDGFFLKFMIIAAGVAFIVMANMISRNEINSFMAYVSQKAVRRI